MLSEVAQMGGGPKARVLSYITPLLWLEEDGERKNPEAHSSERERVVL